MPIKKKPLLTFCLLLLNFSLFSFHLAWIFFTIRIFFHSYRPLQGSRREGIDPFRRSVLSLTHLEVWQITSTNQTFDYTFVLHNSLSLIKVCAYSHIFIKQQLLLIINLKSHLSVFWFWKLLNLHRNHKVFLLNPVYKHIKCIMA